MNTHYDVIIVGAGAAGMMCALEAAKRGRSVWLIDHSRKIGEKIRISGGGRCNFTNIHANPKTYISGNVHFCKSALKQYTQQDFIALVKKHGIAFHEKKLGQLFCDETAQQIIDMMVTECQDAGVVINTEVAVVDIKPTEAGYWITTGLSRRGKEDAPKRKSTCDSFVVATGGLSIPKIGATKFGYEVARQFGLNVFDTRPGLVPLTFQNALLDRCKELTGLSVEATVSYGKTSFSEGLLFTHRGLSGPSILQISSYWKEGEDIIVNLAPDVNAREFFKERRTSNPKQDVSTALSDIVPKRLARSICEDLQMSGRMADMADSRIEKLAGAVNDWRVRPSGTEGYRTAEVTLGGVDCNELSSKTMEARKQSGLFFIGEVVDVTGHLGGFNFQWAWSSGYAAGQHV